MVRARRRLAPYGELKSVDLTHCNVAHDAVINSSFPKTSREIMTRTNVDTHSACTSSMQDVRMPRRHKITSIARLADQRYRNRSYNDSCKAMKWSLSLKMRRRSLTAQRRFIDFAIRQKRVRHAYLGMCRRTMSSQASSETNAAPAQIATLIRSMERCVETCKRV